MKRAFAALAKLGVWVLQPVLVLAILVLGFLGARSLSSTREAPARAESVSYAPLVRAVRAVAKDVPVLVEGNGALQARTRIRLVPQVGGEVVEIHPQLRPGGRFARGEVLVRIEPVDYELAVSLARADISGAETALTTIEAESEAAREEWRQLNPDTPCPPLVAREPQIQEARARLDAARSQLARAELDLERTRLRLPFDGRVVSASVDVGEVVLARTSLGVVYAMDRFEVPVPLRVEELHWLHLPGEQDAGGSPASVLIEAGETRISLPGHLIRIEGELDASSRLARAVVELPLEGLEPRIAARVLPGSFVQVRFEGRLLEGCVEIPRAALRADGVVWTVSEGRLGFVSVTQRHASEGSVLVDGLAPDALVVTSNLEVVTDGMQVRLAEPTEDDR